MRLEYEKYCEWYPKCPKHNEDLHESGVMINYRMYKRYDCWGKYVYEPDKTTHYHCNYKLWEGTPPKLIIEK